MERLASEAPGDTRRVLRRIAEGDLGRLQAPTIEALGGRISRNLERLTGAIVFAALVVGGSMLLMPPIMAGWTYTLGKAMTLSGIVGMLIMFIGSLLRDRGRRRS